jgi:hypothetical protein
MAALLTEQYFLNRNVSFRQHVYCFGLSEVLKSTILFPKTNVFDAK